MRNVFNVEIMLSSDKLHELRTDEDSDVLVADFIRAAKRISFNI